MTTIQFLKKGRGDLTPSPPSSYTPASENLIEHYLWKGIFVYVFSIPKDIIRTQKKKKSFN